MYDTIKHQAVVSYYMNMYTWTNKIISEVSENTNYSYCSWRGGVAPWVARLTRNEEVLGSSPIKKNRCFLEQETLPLLLSTGWFQERIRAWFHNRTK